MNKIYDAIIIGAGPAGISAAIQLKRYGIKFLFLEKDSPGGLLKNASLVENYPGFPKGITGLRLIKLFKKQLSELKIGIKKENVLNIDYKYKLYSIQTNKQIYSSKILIIATGTKPKLLDVNGSSSVYIYYDIHKLFNVQNKDIAIIGGSDAAFDYAVSLSNKNNNILILHRNSKPGCIKSLLKKVLLKKNISYFCNLNPFNIYKDKSKIVIKCDDKRYHKVDYLIAAIGRVPQLDFVKDEKAKIFELLNGYAHDSKIELKKKSTLLL
jgi:thioredoxin reductase (NADPH)